jgi:hypothetical protein
MNRRENKMLLPAVTFVLVPYNNTARTIERVEEVLWPTILAHPELEYELVVSDNSARCDPALTDYLAGRACGSVTNGTAGGTTGTAAR